MKTVAIIQARMGSTRLPGKVMKELHGKTVLEHVITRLRLAKNLDQVAVATTVLSQDDAIEAECARLQVPVHRGSEADVLERYWQAATRFEAGKVVRITSDCPLIDPTVLDGIVQLLDGKRADYASNAIVRTLPRGLDVEAFTFETLDAAHRYADRPEQREHVTPYVHQNPDRFNIVHYLSEIDYSQYRWTLDTPEDWQLISEIYDKLYHDQALFTWEEAIRLMESRPELAAINAHVEQKKL